MTNQNKKQKELLEQEITPFDSFLCFLSSLRKEQVYPVLSEQEREDIESFWDDYIYIESMSELSEWCLSLREYVLGNADDWEQNRIRLTFDDETYYKNRVFKLLGKPLADKILNGSIEDYFEGYTVNNIENNLLNEKLKMYKRLNGKEIPADLSEDFLMIGVQDTCDRFNIASLSFNYNLSLQERWVYLETLHNALEDLSSIIEIKPSQIGLGKLSISFELENTSSYSVENKNININIDFKENLCEMWIKFIDNIIGEKYNFNDENIKFLSHMAFSPIADTSDNITLLKKSIRNKYNLSDSFSSSIIVMKNSFEILPKLLLKIVILAKNPDIKEFINEQVFNLKNIIADVNECENGTETYERWNKWLMDSNNKWNDIDESKEKQIAYREWVYTIALIEKLSFNKEQPKHKMWYIFSIFKDKVDLNGLKYFSSYENLLARSFAVYIESKITKDSWIIYETSDPLLYPYKNERKAEIEWWKTWITSILSLAFENIEDVN